MASGYITSDGKDLDERYLGIDGKAKSSETADVALTSEKATTLNGATPPVSTTQKVTVNNHGNGNKTWTAPSDGIFYGTARCYPGGGITAYIQIRGVKVFESNDPDNNRSYEFKFCLKKGDTIKTTVWRSDYQSGVSGDFYPWVFE
jgi:hypothetical protein